jgi:hypothetical protein
MRGHGERLSRRQEQAIAALLFEPTLAAAAKRIDIGEATLWRWMQVPTFQAAFQAARREVVHGAIRTLQQAAADAVACLRRNLSSGQPAIEVRAADAILNHVLRSVDRIELEERIRSLEEAADARPGNTSA